MIVVIIGITRQKKRKISSTLNREYLNKNERPKFKLCSIESISFAFENIEELTKNNERDKRYFKSFRSLKCSKNDLKRSFYFLKDCIYFCEAEAFFKDQEFLNNLRGLEMLVIYTYLDVEPNEIPHEKMENFEFGKKFELTSDLGGKELEELKLIDWRNTQQWIFWAERYGLNSELGKYCIEQSNS